MALSVNDWSRRLEAHLERSVLVTYGRSRSSPVQARHAPGGLHVRLHEVFAAAPPEVERALASWLRVGRRARRACAELDRFITDSLAELPPRPPRRVRIVQRGAHHDLGPLTRSLLDDEFAGEFDASPPPLTTWSRRGPSRARRSLHLGSYSHHARIVRIHRVLDRAEVPSWFVRSVLHHELLHAALALTGEEAGGHGPVFRRRESRYRDHAAALAWQAKHLPALIRNARRGA